MFTFLLVVHAIIAAALVAVILMQRSEGGGLGMGGSPSGLMSARGAADFLTRSTTILATLFVVMSIAIAALATVQRAPRTIDTSLARQPGAVAPVAPAPSPAGVPLEGDPLAIGGNVATPAAPPLPAAPVAPRASTPAAAPATAPAPVASRARAPAPTTNSVQAAPAPARRPTETPTTVGNPAVSNFSLPASNSSTGNGTVPLGE